MTDLCPPASPYVRQPDAAGQYVRISSLECCFCSLHATILITLLQSSYSSRLPACTPSFVFVGVLLFMHHFTSAQPDRRRKKDDFLIFRRARPFQQPLTSLASVSASAQYGGVLRCFDVGRSARDVFGRRCWRRSN